MNITNPTHLRSFKGRLKTDPTSFTPKLQSGMALIEVLTTTFVLTIGILTPLAVRLCTVSNVCGSESQITVAQTTQNLTEDVLINPAFSEETDTMNDKISHYKKPYGAYITSSLEQLKDSRQTNGFKGKMMKAQPAQAQIAQFKADLAKVFPGAQVSSTICKDSSGAELTYEKRFNAKCDGRGDTTIVKALWLQDVEEESSAESLNTSGHHIVYTYQSCIKDQQ